MADIFVSYSSADRASARRLAQLLEDHGWSVWWDRQIPAGRHFDVFIAQQLRSARAAVVLWSQKAVHSAWVKEEAADARDRELLVPARLDDVDLPLGFRSLQTADLTGWRGEADHGEVRRLIDDIQALIGPPRSIARAQVAQVKDKGPEVDSSAIAFPDSRTRTEGDLPSSPVVADAAVQVEDGEREPGLCVIASPISPIRTSSTPVGTVDALREYPPEVAQSNHATTVSSAAALAENCDESQNPAMHAPVGTIPAAPQQLPARTPARIRKLVLKSGTVLTVVLASIAAAVALVNWNALLRTAPPTITTASPIHSTPSTENKEGPRDAASAPPVPKEQESTEEAATRNAKVEPEKVVPRSPEPPPPAPAFPLPEAGERVIDAGQALTAEQKTNLTARIRGRLTDADPFFIVIVNSLSDFSIEEYSNRLAATWRADANVAEPGLILVVALTEKQAWIRVEPERKTTLTDTTVQRIVDEEICPRLRSGQVATGITAGAAEILKSLVEKKQKSIQTNKVASPALAPPIPPKVERASQPTTQRSARKNQTVSTRCQEVLARAQLGELSDRDREECTK